MSRLSFPRWVRCRRGRSHLLFWCLIGLQPLPGHAEPVPFDLPVEPLATALLDFSAQTRIEVLFSADDLRQSHSSAVSGRYEPGDALNRLLGDKGFAARRTARGAFLIVRVARSTGTIHGRLLTPDGGAAHGIQVMIPVLRRKTETYAHGDCESA